MFGYVAPDKNELKVRELTQYKAYYCGLCRTLGEHYGEASRIFLNYDCAFAAILLSGLFGEGDLCVPHKCTYRPFKKKQPMMPGSAQINNAADLNVILAWHNLRDDAKDDRTIKALGGKLILKGAYQKAKRKQPVLDKIIAQGIGELALLETQCCDELDAPADAFGRTLRDCFAYFSADTGLTQSAMAAMGYNLGKWIYLLDAWEDRTRDARSGSYNVFNATGAQVERAAFLMYYSLNEAIGAYQLLKLARNVEILDNIMMIGCTVKTQAVLQGSR